MGVWNWKAGEINIGLFFFFFRPIPSLRVDSILTKYGKSTVKILGVSSLLEGDLEKPIIQYRLIGGITKTDRHLIEVGGWN
jgi:hypothetical protein